jgi:transglutaminase-like putative cysteine protease
MPPLLLGAGLVFWGWQTGLLPVGLVLAAALEARLLVRSRWDFTRSDFNRASDLSAVMLVLLGVYQAVANESARAVTGVIQWLPLVLFPLLAAQLYSEAGRVEVAVFFWSQRKRPEPTPRVDLTPAYFGLCLLSASTANARATFYAGLVTLSAWALWQVRRRGDVLRWGAAVVVAAALGWVGHVGLAEAQRVVERRAQALFLAWLRRDVDPSRSTTSLGEIGELKLSDRIVMRVEPGAGVRLPALLHQASYNVYHAPSWLAVDAAFAPVLPEADGATWLLRRDEPADSRLTLSAYLTRGRGLLALPHGASRVDELMVVGLARNRFGAVRVDEGLGLVTYTAHFPRRGAVESPPQPSDLRVPPREAPTIAQIAADLGLPGRSPAQVALAVRAHFLGRFSYSRYLAGVRPGRTALEHFLLVSRNGHCEYFASAATLLLRQAGVPARYAVGYAAHEWSKVEQRWVVRARDAHAWTLAWIDGAWVEVDTTPPVWIAEETGPESAWQPLSDFWEWTTYLFSRWRWSERQDRLTGNLGWLLIPLIAVLVWRLWARRRVRPGAGVTASAPARPAGAGRDSEFYRVERRLAELGFARPPGEPLGRWLDVVAGAAPPALATAPLRPLLALHYRYRFDPAGLAAGERRRLREDAEAWLAAHPPAPASAPAAAP